MAVPTTVASVVTEFVQNVQAIAPRLLAAVVFVAIVGVAIAVVRRALRRVLMGVYPAEHHQIARLVLLVATVGLWFGAGLALLSILGMEEVAASLGTAAGFLALGVSYALSSTIADTVAGLYLIRDPDFNPGDAVTTADVTGTVREIGLRKSRLELEDGDVVVLANKDVENRWRLETA